jgi:hypothetical protein
MSTIQVNNIQPYSGDTLHLSSSITYISGALSVATSITSSGDLRFSNIGTGTINPVTNVSASGTSSLNPIGFSTTNSDTYLDYGVNVIKYADAENYCIKLPQTPQKGKELTIINLSGAPIHIFPGIDGGSINGIINNSEMLPSNGIAYKFVCWENPLPGGWSVVSPPSPGGIVQSDVIGGLYITQSLIPSPWGNFSSIVSNNIFVTGGAYTNMSTANTPYSNINSQLLGAELGSIGEALTWITPTQSPEIAWRKINSITVYTNLQSTDNGTYDSFLRFSLTSAVSVRAYAAGTFTQYPPIQSVYNNFITNTLIPFRQSVGIDIPYIDSAAVVTLSQSDPSLSNNTVPGTLVPINPSYTPLTLADFTGNLSANPGDPGTTYYNIDVNPNAYYGKGAGLIYLGTVNDINGAHDMYSLSIFGLTFFHPKELYINGLKLRFVINYESL